eukprot:GGOE01024953.1.p1 GENE.GGOE01024953.1~~GGOE01024953.1.p1  ORF type:complete len:1437 (+),score=454.40 GGOE01024953.1:1098-5408(+)
MAAWASSAPTPEMLSRANSVPFGVPFTIDPDLLHGFQDSVPDLTPPGNSPFGSLPSKPTSQQRAHSNLYGSWYMSAATSSNVPANASAIVDLDQHLELLTNVGAQRDLQRSDDAEGKPDPPDPADVLLANGLEELLKRAKTITGSERHPGILVSFDSLKYIAQTFQGSNVVVTVGNAILNVLLFWRRRRRLVHKAVLAGVSGSFRPGCMTLILGPPQSGKSSLMKALTGQLIIGRHCNFDGTVRYADRDLLAKHQPKGEVKLDKVVGFIPQLDLHIPTLTVRETMHFAHRCVALATVEQLRKEGYYEDKVNEILAIDKLSPEITMVILGIRHVGDTLVGNEKLRGISGGQRKRLTTGEILVTRNPVLLADEISTGLDSATTFDICCALRSAARVSNRTIVISLLQPTPETYGVFDEVLVMTGGHIAFQGPREEVLPYFERLGFRCPPTKDAAEFLQEVTLPKSIERYRVSSDVDVPMSPEDFGMAWQTSALYRQRREDDIAWTETSRQELDKVPKGGYVEHKLTSEYSNGFMKNLLLCLRRQACLTARNKPATRGRVVQIIFMSLMLGSLFFQISFSDYNGKYAVIFFTMMFLSLSGMALIPAVVSERAVIYRQLRAKFYPSLPYSAAVSIMDLPVSAIEALLFVTITYWMCDFSSDAADFFQFVCMVFMVKISMTMYFRMLAMLMPTDVAAQGFAAITVLLLNIQSGYLLAQADIQPWWIWLYWINPLQYGMTTLAMIEFHSSRYAVPMHPTDPNSITYGNYYLSQKNMPTDSIRLPLGFVFNLGFYLLMVLLHGIILRFVRWGGKFPPQPPPTEAVEVPEAREVPFTPVVLTWQGVTYDVDAPGKRGKRAKLGLRLLDGVSGFAQPNTLTALMGSSGAGKTTLLDVLAGRKNTGKVGGSILLNGQAADPVTFSRFAGYVEQMDIHSPSATVVEALRFSATLRLPRELSDEDKEAYVWRVIRMLQLEPQANCPIGTRQSGLTVEQVKRVTIGVEMVANPAVIFLDEPTSGLDSMAADVVMDAIKAVAKTGRTVICTIHQPSTHLFEMFDHLLLLMRGGKTVFFGETGEMSAHLVKYFNDIPLVPQHDGHQNPATWMLNVLAVEGIDFAEEFLHSALHSSNTLQLEVLSQSVGPTLTAGHRYQATMGTQFRALLLKWLRIHWRSPSYNLTRVVICALLGLVLGSIFWQLAITNSQSVFSKVGVQFNAFIFIGVVFASVVQTILSTERTVYYREKAANMYRPFLFNIVAGMCELPYLLFITFMYTNIMYWMVGLNPDPSVFFFWYLTFALYVLFCTNFGFMLGCLLPSPEMASAMVAATSSIFSLLCGFMQPTPSIGWWWRWLHYAIPLTYAFQCAESVQFYCEAADLDPSHPGDCPTFTANTNGVPKTVAVWPFVRDNWDLEYGMRWWYIGVLVLFCFAARVGSGLALAFINHDKR